VDLHRGACGLPTSPVPMADLVTVGTPLGRLEPRDGSPNGLSARRVSRVFRPGAPGSRRRPVPRRADRDHKVTLFRCREGSLANSTRRVRKNGISGSRPIRHLRRSIPSGNDRVPIAARPRLWIRCAKGVSGTPRSRASLAKSMSRACAVVEPRQRVRVTAGVVGSPKAILGQRVERGNVSVHGPPDGSWKLEVAGTARSLPFASDTPAVGADAAFGGIGLWRRRHGSERRCVSAEAQGREQTRQNLTQARRLDHDRRLVPIPPRLRGLPSSWRTWRPPCRREAFEFSLRIEAPSRAPNRSHLALVVDITG